MSLCVGMCNEYRPGKGIESLGDGVIWSYRHCNVVPGNKLRS